MCRSITPGNGFMIVENTMKETIEMRSDLMKALKVVVAELINEKPVESDLNQVQSMKDLVLELGGENF